MKQRVATKPHCKLTATTGQLTPTLTVQRETLSVAAEVKVGYAGSQITDDTLHMIVVEIAP